MTPLATGALIVAVIVVLLGAATRWVAWYEARFLDKFDADAKQRGEDR
jgi:hypothetical protein